MKTVFILLTITISLIIIPMLISEPSFNGSSPGCSGSGCHTFSDGDVSITILDTATIQVSVSGTTSRVGGELVDENGVVVEVINSTSSNPFILNIPAAGNYIVNAGYKNPSRRWDSAAVAIIVPVELASFNAFINENDVTLNWQTASELNNSGFQVERKKENNEWNEIGFVSGNGTSTEIHKYIFEDNNLSAGKYNYRIKQIDFDGTFEYFYLEEEIIIVSPSKFILLQNYPNPFNPTTSIEFSIPEKTNVLLKVFNSIGEEIKTLLNDVKPAGSYEIEFNANGLSSGIYYYKLEANNYVKTMKMILLK